MPMTLQISRELSLPAEAVSETFAILAKRGAGKTYTAAVLVEELLKAGLQVVVVDPVGVWGVSEPRLMGHVKASRSPS
jgi:uncharacterized protein